MKIRTAVLSSMLAFGSISSVFANQVSNADFEKAFFFSYDKYEPSVFSKQIAVTEWNSEEGIKMFERSKYKGDFYRLAPHFKPQAYPATCGIASAVTVLSSIYQLNNKKLPLLFAIPVKPLDKMLALEYRMLNEDNFFNDATDKIVDRRAVKMMYYHDVKNKQFMGGIDMEELVKMFKAHGVKANATQVKQVTDAGINSFRDLVKKVVNSKDQFIIANFNRSYQNIIVGGHYSPIAGYDQDSDSVLLLDVAAHKNVWIWVKLEDFYRSMNSSTYSGKDHRGYILVNTKI